MNKVDAISDKRPNEPARVVTYWLNELTAARKREKEFRKEGQRVIDIYDGKEPEKTPFNILYSNTETMLPALYSATPRPVVQRRFKDEDPLGKAAALAGQRVLEFLLDTNSEGYETFDRGMKMAALDGLLPGRGITCVKYDAAEGRMDDGTEEGSAYKKAELVCIETRVWNRVFFGYAKTWAKVPWVAYEEHIDKQEATRLFGAEVASKIVFTQGEESEEERQRNDERNTGERKTALVYQIWDKDGDGTPDSAKKIRYISASYPDGFLGVKDDPLGLTGFFNCPKPLQFMEKSNDLMPVALYCLYENQARELNRITTRINRIVEALKARGVYDSELGEDLANLMKADDNALVPSDKTSSLAAEKGLQNAIWFMPLDVLVGVLERLYIAREQCKAVIYEITGISDIMRSATRASETFGAQELKSQWGTMRLKPKQFEVQRYARDLLRMMLEIAATKFSEETWAKMTGLPFLTSQEKMQLDSIMAAAQGQAQQMAAMGQQPAPQQMQQMRQLQSEMQKPVWGDVLNMLRDDTQRAYRIDIETNSTVQPEAVEDQKNISEVMTALGQFLNGVTPLVVSGSMPFEAAQSMMLAIVRRFRFGGEIEDQIKAMQAPKPPDDGKAAQQAQMQAEQARMQQEQQARAAEMQFEAQKFQAEEQRAQQVEMAKHQREQEAEANRIALERERMALERQNKLDDIAAEREATLAKLNADRATARMEAELAQQTEMNKASLAAAVAIKTAEIQAEAAQRQAEVSDAQQAESDAKDEAKEAQAGESNAMMQQILQIQTELLAQFAKPKSVTSSKTGAVYTLKTA